jgi:hypothetical protein
MVEERGKAVRACSGPQLRRGTSLVTTTHVLKAGFVSLSQVVEGGGVLCRVMCVCSLFVGLLCGGVRFGELCANCYFFLNDTAVLLFLFQKNMVATRNHRNFSWESLIPHEFSVENRTLFTPGVLDLCHFVILESGLHMTVLGTLLMKIINGRSVAQGRGRDTRWKWIRFLEELARRGRATPFPTDPELYECGKCGRLGHNSRTCHWQISQVQFHYIHIVFFAHLYFDVPFNLQCSFRYYTDVTFKFRIIFISVLMFISDFLQDGAVPSAGSGVRPAPPRTSSGGGACMDRFFDYSVFPHVIV